MRVTTPEPPSQPLWARVLALGALATFFSVWAWSPAIAAYPRTQAGDGPFFHRIVEAARVSVTRFHELPLWNPFECGGVPLWDNPQSITAAPLLWLTLALPIDVTRVMELWYVTHSVLGFVSMWLFARHELKLTRLATLAVSIVWTFAGFHHHHLGGGHTTFVGFLYLPLAFLLWRRAEEDLRMAVGVGLLFAWMIFEGAVYPLPHFVVALGAETLTRAWPPRRLARIARAAAVVGVVAVAVGAARFLPVLDQIRSHSRNLGAEGDSIAWKTFADMFTTRFHNSHMARRDYQQYVWGEYASYVGPAIVILALLGILATGIEYAWMLGLLLFLGALMLGHFAKFAPWTILKAHVFPFKEMRVPSRFAVEVTFFLVSFAGLAVDRFVPAAQRALERFGRIGARAASSEATSRWLPTLQTALVGLALVGAGDVLGLAVDFHSEWFNGGPVRPVEPSARLFIGGANQAAYLDQPRSNRGRLDCWEEWGVGPGAPLWEGDVPQARMRPGDGDASAGVVEVANRTQNTFTIDVNVLRPSVVLVNSTYDKGWRSSAGRVFELDKQLAVELPPGEHQLRLRYWPRTMTAGLVLTPIGLLASILYIARPDLYRRRKRK